jgi:hypothetical protein
MKEESKMNEVSYKQYEVGYYDSRGWWWGFEQAHDIFNAREQRARLGSGSRFCSNGQWKEPNGGWTIIEKKTTTTTRIVEENEQD